MKKYMYFYLECGGVRTMKYLKNLMVFIFIVLLSACSVRDYKNVAYTEAGVLVNDKTNYDSDALGENNLDPRPYAFADQNKVSLIDVTTGHALDSYTFDEYERVYQIWNLDNGYIVALVGYEDLFSREARLRRLENNFDLSNIEDDERAIIERNLRFILFDEQMNILTTVNHASFMWQGFVKYSDGQIYAYDWISQSEEEWLGPWDLRRINLLTRESVVMLEEILPLTIMGFMDDNTAIVNGSIGGETGSVFRGTLNVSTGEKKSFGIDEFSPRSFSSNGKDWLATEVNSRWWGGEITSQVFVFNTNSMTGKMVQLVEEDSYWARLTLDGEFIIALDQIESMVRKYDLNGSIINEAKVALPENFNTFEIFPITNEKHLLVTQILDANRHFQIISFP